MHREGHRAQGGGSVEEEATFGDRSDRRRSRRAVGRRCGIRQDRPNAASKLPSSSCCPIFYKGSGSPQYLIASDLPLQGAGRAQPLSMVKAIQYVLEKQFKFRAGTFPSATSRATTRRSAGWLGDREVHRERACVRNDRSVLGVLGTFNSGCAKLEIPILNRAPGGAVAMMSPANTAVGLTHEAPWNDPGEPNIYYPTGVRNYARVASTDDFQGPFAADLLKRIKKRSVYILHDNQTFGKGVANAFRSRANKLDIDVRASSPGTRRRRATRRSVSASRPPAPQSISAASSATTASS